MSFTIIYNDITKLRVYAIVNAANTKLAMGGGICGAVFKAAGAERMNNVLRTFKRCRTGHAVLTPGFDLPAKYVIHAVGPIWKGGAYKEEELLRAAYTNSLKLAFNNRCESIVFPLISSGIYAYPKDEALRTAAFAIRDFIKEHDIDVSLALFEYD